MKEETVYIGTKEELKEKFKKEVNTYLPTDTLDPNIHSEIKFEDKNFPIEKQIDEMYLSFKNKTDKNGLWLGKVFYLQALSLKERSHPGIDFKLVGEFIRFAE